MKTYNFKFYTDPSHGWIEAPIELLMQLGITGKISRYSYRKGDQAYLEEDCDAGLLLQAIKAQGHDVKLDYKHSDNDSFIRNLPRF